MKVLSSFVLYFFILLSLSFANDMNAEFNLAGEPSVLKEGDIVEGVLKVWPIESADFNEFKKLQGTTFFNSLYLAEIHSVEVSANNADLVELKGLFLVNNPMKQDGAQINYKGQVVSFKSPSVRIVPLEKKEKDYFVLDQSLSYSNGKNIFLSLIASVLLFFLFWKRNFIRTFLTKFKQDPTALSVKMFNEKFLKASKREEYEEIYSLKEEWVKLVKEQAPAYQEFFKVMNQHQYKKNWGVEELNDVQHSFDIIRGSFK